MNAKALVAITIALGASTAVIACVLADPPPIVTPPPQTRPKIIVDSVSPPLGELLRTSPPCTNVPTDCFVVPVEADPNASLTYRVFIDLDPKGSPTQGAVVNQTDDGGVLAVGPDASTNGEHVFTFSVGNASPFDPTQCHTITVIVAYGFVDNDFSKPLPPGGDTATWFYQPVDDCTFYDAGAVPDAGTD